MPEDVPPSPAPDVAGAPTPSTAAVQELPPASAAVPEPKPGPLKIEGAAKDDPMLDVHPPHHAIESWKQYLLHMSTIVLGLLIAIGLEQTVEAVHRADERSDLREALRHDNEKALEDAEKCEMAEIPSLTWLTARAELLQRAIAAGKPPVGNISMAPRVSSDIPSDPAWNAAKASGLLPLLSREEVQVFSFTDAFFTHIQQAFDNGVAASRRRAQFESTHASSTDLRMMDLTKISVAELNDYSDLIGQEISDWDEYRVINSYLRGVETEVLRGQLDLTRIRAAQRQFYMPLPVALAAHREKNPAQAR